MINTKICLTSFLDVNGCAEKLSLFDFEYKDGSLYERGAFFNKAHIRFMIEGAIHSLLRIERLLKVLKRVVCFYTA